ncbi:class I SAM-dependent methyltransferase [Prolixibacter denitrificans]|nr:class I SAM-dependent methyltransferase [Prolixibacter denitrificans]
MTQKKQTKEPDNTAVRTALWRALHVQVDAEPHILEDGIGLKLVAPPDGWQERPDMKYTQRLRASVVARARLIEDFVVEQNQQGIEQYVILGAGLDTFAQRRQEAVSPLHIFEIDQPDTMTWKEQRLNEIGLDVPDNLHFVPVDFETSSWWEQLLAAGFNISQPAVVACTGVSLYLTEEAIVAMLKQLAGLVANSQLIMSFYLPLELLDEEDQQMQQMAEKGAREAGTPMVSFFNPDKILNLAREAGFKKAKTLSTKDIVEAYFANRTDDLVPASGEVFLIATI